MSLHERASIHSTFGHDLTVPYAADTPPAGQPGSAPAAFVSLHDRVSPRSPHRPQGSGQAYARSFSHSTSSKGFAPPREEGQPGAQLCSPPLACSQADRSDSALCSPWLCISWALHVSFQAV